MFGSCGMVAQLLECFGWLLIFNIHTLVFCRSLQFKCLLIHAFFWRFGETLRCRNLPSSRPMGEIFWRPVLSKQGKTSRETDIFARVYWSAGRNTIRSRLAESRFWLVTGAQWTVLLPSMWLHSVGVEQTFSHPQQRQQSLHKLWPMRSCKNESHLTCLCETFVYTTSYGAPSKNRWCFDVLKKTRAKDCADGRVHPVARSQSSLHSLRVWSGTNLAFKFPRCLTSPKQFVVILIWRNTSRGQRPRPLPGLYAHRAFGVCNR